MNEHLDERLTRSLERQASRVSPRSDLTRAALRQASRIRARRRAGAVVASIAVLAVAVPVGVQILDDGTVNGNVVVGPSTTTTSSPTEAPSPRPSASRPEQVRKQVWNLDFTTLDRGPAPAVPYVDGGTIHEGGATRKLGPDDRLLAIVGAGDVVWVADPGTTSSDLVLVRPHGDRQTLTESGIEAAGEIAFAGVSADRTRMAWSVSVPGADGSGGSAVLTYADAETGEVLNTTDVAAERRAIGFVKDQVVVSNHLDGAFLWTGATDAITRRPGAWMAWSTAPAPGLVSLGRPLSYGNQVPCGSVADVTEPGKDLWSNCDYRVDAFSPSGEFATSIHVQTDGLGPGLVQLVETRTGKVLVTIEASLRTPAVWESERSVLMSAHVGGEWALVRCSVDGACELATEPRKGTPEETGVYAVDRK